MPLHNELQALSVRALRERAEADGIDGGRIEVARDDDNAKAALTALILEKASSLDVDALRALKKPELRQRAAHALIQILVIS